MSPAPILVTGGTGFIGRHVVAALLGAIPLRLRLLVHRTVPASLAGRVEVVRADLAETSSLRGVCEGASALLHLACEISDDAGRCDLVNGRGTEALVAEAQRAGVRQVIYLGNTAVYGYAVHRGARESEVKVDPATPVSRSRARAERAVLAVGGVVLRPSFVYGEGDTRFIPAVIRALDRFGFIVGRGRARLSVIAVDDLARVIRGFAWPPYPREDNRAFHANDNQPVRFLEIAQALQRCLGLSIPTRSLPYGIARHILRFAAGRAWSPSMAHRVFLVTHDHYYDASGVWERLAQAPGPPIALRLADHAAWYRRFLAPATRVVA